jgi:hypothetical protein
MARVIFFVQAGLRGTRSRSLFSSNRRMVSFSSSSVKRKGFWPATAGALIIFTLRRSGVAHTLNTVLWTSQSVTNKLYAPAVKSVSANDAVLRNSSRSRSCVTDWSRVVFSTSVVYLHQLSGCSADRKVESTYPARFCRLALILDFSVDDGSTETT